MAPALLAFNPNQKPNMKPCNLILHCGAHAASIDEVKSVDTPKPTMSWVPIPHASLMDLVTSTLQTSGLKVVNTAHSLTKEGNRYFGLIQVTGKQSSPDYSWVLGLRNSHDKSFPAGIVAGASVFVCDNLSFSGEVVIARKHTTYIMRDLPRLTGEAVGRLMDSWHHQDQRIEAYQGSRLSESRAHDLIIRAVDIGACCNQMIPHVISEWREPKYTEFRKRTAWSLFNAFTEALKGNLTELPKRTQRLHALLDTHCGLSGNPMLN